MAFRVKGMISKKYLFRLEGLIENKKASEPSLHDQWADEGSTYLKNEWKEVVEPI